MIRILVVEDELSIRSFIVLNLKKAGYAVEEAENGEDALEKFEQQEFDLLLLDVMLPGLNGFQVCQKIRETNVETGIIMLTAKVQDDDKVEGLTLGADDYLTKPFSPKELLARISALLRRINKKPEQEELESGQFTLFLKEKRVQKAGNPLVITPTEYELLLQFMKREGEIITRDELLDLVWGKSYVGDPKIVDVNIRRLRRKIEPQPSSPKYVQTVWGRGYRWAGESE
ncbi:MAG: response regulator transcription factor [Anaerobacillus sp.]